MSKEKNKKNAAVITGASKGIGAGIACKLSQEGFPVVINYVRSKDKAEKVLKKIKNNGGQGIIFQADVTNSDQVKEMFLNITKYYR